MHEIRATMELEHVAETVRLAQAAGIERVSIADVHIHGSETRQQVVSVETSTPNARLYVENLLASPSLIGADYTITSRELRAIVDNTDLATLTKPMGEPFPDVIQDLWQLTQVTTSYVSRAAAGGILMAAGIVDNNAVAIVVAALFLPFLAEVLAVSFGLWSRDRQLIRRGLTAIALSTILALTGGLIVGLAAGGPVLFTAFKSPLPSFAFSAIIGITAGLSSADDTGRRYLIGVAAAVQLAIFPAWLGTALIVGLPGRAVVVQRLLSFAINLITISGSALAAYAALHLEGGWRAPRSRRQETS